MYHRHIGEDENKYTVTMMAEKLRKVLSRALVLVAVLTAAPYLFGMMTGGSLNHLAGTDAAAWQDMQWALIVALIFMVMGLVGIARMRPGIKEGECTSAT